MIKNKKVIPRVALLIDQSREYERKLMEGISRYIQLHGPWLLYRVSPFYISGSQPINFSNLLKWKPDGVIVRENFFTTRFLQSKIPVIYAAYFHREKNLPGIYANNRAIAEMGADYFIKKGYRHFAFCHLSGYFWSTERMDAFQNYLREKGFEPFIYHHQRPKGQIQWQSEPHKIAQWLKTLPKPLALMSTSDECSLQIIEAAKLAEIMIPEEIALLGVDNDESICNTTHPTLSSIDQNPEWAGYEAAKLLDRLMKGKIKKPNDIIAQPKGVVTRHSTDILAIHDKVVASAINYIKQNATSKHITVNDVAAQLNLSRRMLEIRFRKSLNYTIHDAIREFRIKRIKYLLTDSDMTISEIAFETGFPGVDSLSRYFHSYEKCSPSEYRKNLRN
jgi:LacI family transcriptional regulator